MSEINKKNLSWVNYAKLFCMILIYFQHTMNRIGFSSLPSSISVSMWYKPFYVNLFFFVSGYLLFKKYRQINFNELDDKSWDKYGTLLFNNIVYKIAIPTVIFSAVMLLKLAIRGNYAEFLNSMIIDSILANSMWFTAALTISELIFYFIFKFHRSKYFIVYSIISIILSVVATKLTLSDFTIANNNYIPWRYKSGMIATLFLVSGGLYEKYEHYISKLSIIVKSILYSSLLIFYIIGLVYFEEIIYTNVAAGRITVLGYFIVISISLLVIQLCKCCKPNSFIDYFGRHTIVLYFFSGALPETIGLIMMKIRPTLDWMQVLSATILSLLAAFALTYLINQYIPWLLDFRLLRKK